MDSALAASYQLSTHHGNVTRLNPFDKYDKYCFGRCPFEPAKLVPVIFGRRTTYYSSWRTSNFITVEPTLRPTWWSGLGFDRSNVSLFIQNQDYTIWIQFSSHFSTLFPTRRLSKSLLFRTGEKFSSHVQFYRFTRRTKGTIQLFSQFFQSCVVPPYFSCFGFFRAERIFYIQTFPIEL